MKLGRRFVEKLGRRASWILSAKILLSLFVLVYGVSISISSTTYRAEFGSTLSTATGLIAIDKGFSIANSGSTATGTSCSTPVVFSGSPGTANTAITSGDFVYDVKVNSTAGATPNVKYNVTLTLASSPYGPLCIQNAGTPANGQTIDCKFDVGATLPSSPYAFKVTVQ